MRLVLEVRTRNQAAMAVVRKGPPDHPRLGRSVSLRAKHARVWPTADLRGNRLRRWLWRKDRRTRGLCKFFTDDRLPGQYKLWNWPLPAAWKP